MDLIRRLTIIAACFALTAVAETEVPTTGEVQRLSVVFTHENSKFEELFRDFEAETGIKVDPVWIDQSDLKARLIVVAETHNTPDVVFCPSDFLGLKDYVRFSEVPPALITQPISEENRNTVIINNKLFGVPIISGNHLMLYYNKKLVGVPASDWEQLKAQRALLPENKQLIAWSFMEMYWFVPFITGFGETPMLSGRPNMATPAVQAGLKFVWDLAKQGYVDESCGYECAFSNFVNGNAAYTINGIWSYHQFKNLLGDDLGVALLPTISQQPMRSYFSTIVAAFPHDSLNGKKQSAIRQLIQHIQSERFQLKMWRELHDFPVHKDVVTSIAEENDDDLGILLHGLEQAKPMPLEKNMLYIWESMLKGYSRYGSGAMTAEDASIFMQRLAERSIDR